nr:hypothetical protein [Tanacetum cinerariifolium]
METTFFEYRQTNPFVDAVSAIPGVDDQPIVQTSQLPEWFSQPKRPPSPDRDWNKTLPAAQG